MDVHLLAGGIWLSWIAGNARPIELKTSLVTPELVLSLKLFVLKLLQYNVAIFWPPAFRH